MIHETNKLEAVIDRHLGDVTIKVNPRDQLMAEVRAFCAGRGCSVRDWVRECVRAALDEELRQAKEDVRHGAHS